MTTRAVDGLFAGAFLALGAYIVAEALDYGYLRDGAPGPGFFPFWVGLALVALSAVNLARSASGAERLRARFDAPTLRKTATIMALIGVFILVTPWLGMIVASGLLVPALALAIEPRWTAGTAVTILALTVVFPVFCYVLFAVYLNVPLVRGVFGV